MPLENKHAHVNYYIGFQSEGLCDGLEMILLMLITNDNKY